MRRLGTALATCLCAVSVCVTAHGEEPQDQGEYLSFLPAYVLTDRVLARSGHGANFTSLYGRPLSDTFGLEAGYSGSILESGVPAGTDYYQQGLYVDGVYNFRARQQDAFVPYALIGIGAAHDDFSPDSRDRFTGMLDAGFGLVSAPVLSHRFRLRAEVRYVYDISQQGHHEPRAALGIEIPLWVSNH
jgi:hypothetical protein